MSTPSSPNKPIREAIKARQREVARQTAEMKWVSGIEDLEQRPPAPTPLPPKPVKVVVPPQPDKRATQTVDYGARATQTLEIVRERASWTRRQLFTLLAALTLASLICVGASLIAAGDAFRGATPTLQPLPVVQANDVIARLRQVGVLLSAVQTVSVPNSIWTAQQETRFTAQQDADRGTFIVLSYSSANLAGADAFRASLDKTWHTWHVVQINNVLFLVAPDAAPKLTAQLESHLTSYLVAPYRWGLATATPTLIAVLS